MMTGYANHRKLTIETLWRVVGGVLKEGCESFAIVEFGPNMFDDEVHYRKLPVAQHRGNFTWIGPVNGFFECPVWEGEPIEIERVVALQFSESDWLIIDKDVNHTKMNSNNENYVRNITYQIEMSLREASGQPLRWAFGVTGMQGTQGYARSTVGTQGYVSGTVGTQGYG